MKLNNKGFAITSVLYGLLILFVLLVGSYLTILTARKNRVDIITSRIEKNNYFSHTSNEIVIEDINTFKAPYTGKYILNYNESENDDCYIYLKKEDGINIANIVGGCTISNGTKAVVYY